jgi:hypothetical protein
MDGRACSAFHLLLGKNTPAAGSYAIARLRAHTAHLAIAAAQLAPQARPPDPIRRNLASRMKPRSKSSQPHSSHGKPL